jgi:hypothetical protein
VCQENGHFKVKKKRNMKTKQDENEKTDIKEINSKTKHTNIIHLNDCFSVKPNVFRSELLSNQQGLLTIRLNDDEKKNQLSSSQNHLNPNNIHSNQRSKSRSPSLIVTLETLKKISYTSKKNIVNSFNEINSFNFDSLNSFYDPSVINFHSNNKQSNEIDKNSSRSAGYNRNGSKTAKQHSKSVTTITKKRPETEPKSKSIDNNDDGTKSPDLNDTSPLHQNFLTLPFYPPFSLCKRSNKDSPLNKTNDNHEIKSIFLFLKNVKLNFTNIIFCF